MNETPIICIEVDRNNIYVKREDLIPYSFGGNKVRKAINFFREIDHGGYDCVVTYGSSSSNHCRVISNMAAARKMPCYIISPQESSVPTYNSKMMDLFNAIITTVPVDEVHETIEAKLDQLRKSGNKPYFIPGGGHGNLGTQAYVDCYEEIVNYEEREGIHFDYIFLASGTGTTQAGLICGHLIHQDVRKIIGISIARKVSRGRPVIVDSVKEYFQEKNFTIDNEAIEQATIFMDDYTDNGYGNENSEIIQVIEDMLTNKGIPLDSTYTGKAYTGMLNYLETNKITGKNILFIHTGGTPLFFDDLEKRL